MSDLNTQFLKKYAYAFVAEAKHFLSSEPEIAKLIDEHGQSYRLVKKKTPNENELENPFKPSNQDEDNKSDTDVKILKSDETTDSKDPTPKRYTGKKKKLDKFSKRLQAHPPRAEKLSGGSDLDVTEVGQQNKSLMPIRKRVIRKIKPRGLAEAIQSKVR